MQDPTTSFILPTPVGKKVHAAFDYKAGSWDSDHRVVAKAEHGGLGPNQRYVVTNLKGPTVNNAGQGITAVHPRSPVLGRYRDLGTSGELRWECARQRADGKPWIKIQAFVRPQCL